MKGFPQKVSYFCSVAYKFVSKVAGDRYTKNLRDFVQLIQLISQSTLRSNR